MVIVGISMGGMLAQEMAEAVGAAGVVLVSSCRNARPIPWFQGWFGRMVSRLPLGAVEFLKHHLPPKAYHRLGDLAPEHATLVRRMFLDTPTAMLRWAPGAMVHWTGRPASSMNGVRVRHIHGDRDALLLSARVEPDQWIRGAGHAMSMTHAEEVNAFIRQCVSEIAQSNA